MNTKEQLRANVKPSLVDGLTNGLRFGPKFGRDDRNDQNEQNPRLYDDPVILRNSRFNDQRLAYDPYGQTVNYRSRSRQRLSDDSDEEDDHRRRHF